MIYLMAHNGFLTYFFVFFGIFSLRKIHIHRTTINTNTHRSPPRRRYYSPAHRYESYRSRDRHINSYDDYMRNPEKTSRVSKIQSKIKKNWYQTDKTKIMPNHERIWPKRNQHSIWIVVFININSNATMPMPMQIDAQISLQSHSKFKSIQFNAKSQISKINFNHQTLSIAY